MGSVAGIIITALIVIILFGIGIFIWWFFFRRRDFQDICPPGTERTVDGVCIPAGACFRDNDCPGQQFCSQGRCVSCTLDSECALAEVCMDGVCRNKQCQNNAACPGSNLCQDGVCQPFTCSSSADCINGEACINNFCVPVNRSCIADKQCFDGLLTCINGRCVQCTNDNDCPTGSSCRNGVCSLVDGDGFVVRRAPGGRLIVDDNDEDNLPVTIDRNLGVDNIDIRDIPDFLLNEPTPASTRARVMAHARSNRIPPKVRSRLLTKTKTKRNAPRPLIRPKHSTLKFDPPMINSYHRR
jgi:Cys-rich repeat protein